MYFSVGIELPKTASEAFGLFVPALSNGQMAFYSAADTQDDITPNVTEAITLMLETMQEAGLAISGIKDAGVLAYQQMADYTFCDTCVLVHVAISAFED